MLVSGGDCGGSTDGVPKVGSVRNRERGRMCSGYGLGTLCVVFVGDRCRQVRRDWLRWAKSSRRGLESGVCFVVTGWAIGLVIW